MFFHLIMIKLIFKINFYDSTFDLVSKHYYYKQFIIIGFNTNKHGWKTLNAMALNCSLF